MNSKVLKLIKKIKAEYIQLAGGLDTLKFEEWLERLNKDEYNEIFDCLQVNQNNQFLLIRYGLAEMQRGMWTDPNSIYRECRSVVLDLDKERLVIRPMKKFFNLNEVEENKLENVEEEMKTAKVVEYADKLDGSMQNATWYDDDVFMAGSMAINVANSWRLEDGISRLTPNHRLMLRENEYKTFVFEYISMKDAHVVIYDKSQEGLYLLAIIDNETGYEYNYEQVKDVGNWYGVKTVDLENTTLDIILKKMKTCKSSDKEGWVINIDGHRIKIKCDDYVMLHRLLDKISSINVIIKNIADDHYDDMMAKIPDAYKSRVEKIANMIFDYKKTTEDRISIALGVMPKDLDTRGKMIWINDLNKDIQAYVRMEVLGQSYNILKTTNRYKKLRDMGITADYSALFADLEE